VLSRIPDPKIATKERGEKEICFYNFFEATKITKLGQFTKNYKSCHLVIKFSKIWVWEKTYSGSRIQGSKRHRIPDPNPQH
jgi:hypothetical protein